MRFYSTDFSYRHMDLQHIKTLMDETRKLQTEVNFEQFFTTNSTGEKYERKHKALSF